MGYSVDYLSWKDTEKLIIVMTTAPFKQSFPKPLSFMHDNSWTTFQSVLQDFWSPVILHEPNQMQAEDEVQANLPSLVLDSGRCWICSLVHSENKFPTEKYSAGPGSVCEANF